MRMNSFRAVCGVILALFALICAPLALVRNWQGTSAMPPRALSSQPAPVAHATTTQPAP